MKLISWNVNGLRAILKKDFLEQFNRLDADIFCLQEIKMQEDNYDFYPDGYHVYFNCATSKKGYSGTAVLTKEEPIDVVYGIDHETIDGEGRVITCEFEDFYLVNVYVPNSQSGLKRIDFRVEFERELRNHLTTLNQIKSVILCGDLNVAHRDIDLASPDENRNSPGFSDQEIQQFELLLDEGFIDAFRYLYPNETGKYTWWDYRTFGRKKNDGWRIDYFIVSQDMIDDVEDAIIYMDEMGSDHCPVGLELV